jgi:hypothetical protein
VTTTSRKTATRSTTCLPCPRQATPMARSSMPRIDQHDRWWPEE